MIKKILGFFCFLLFSSYLYSQTLYWEAPVSFAKDNARFSQVAYGDGIAVIAWQRFYMDESGKKTATIFYSVSEDGKIWSDESSLISIPFEGDETSFYSLVVDKKGYIVFAVNLKGNLTRVFVSKDKGNTFLSSDIKAQFDVGIGPRLFLKSDDGYILFISQSVTDSISLFYSISSDAIVWSPLTQLESNTELELNFLPYHISHNNKDYVVFQSAGRSERGSYQLYCKVSEDGGLSWSSAIPLTEQADPEYTSARFDDFDNQRPSLAVIDGSLYVTWERAYRNGNPAIYIMRLEDSGYPAEPPQRVSSTDYIHRAPRLFSYKGKEYLLWFDNRRGEEHVILAEKRGIVWREKDLSVAGYRALFPDVLNWNQELFLIWEDYKGSSSRIVMLKPDRTVNPPKIIPPITEGAKSRVSSLKISWIPPEDSSGIAGYNYIWTRSPAEHVPHVLSYLGSTKTATVNADEDGKWYFKIIAQDYAGNWSEEKIFSYVLDTTPPEPVVFSEPEKDENGYLKSNTFTLSWEPPEENIKGYSTSLTYLGAEESIPNEILAYIGETFSEDDKQLFMRKKDINTPASFDSIYDSKNLISAFIAKIKEPPVYVTTQNNTVKYNNIDNGIWAFSVRAFDSVGNAGKSRTIVFKLNKYIPVTYVTYLTSDKSRTGEITITIYGRGFAEGGYADTVFLDKDGLKPYDYVFTLSEGQFSVDSDRRISGIKIDNPEEGQYYVGVIHPLRGLYLSRRPLIALEPGGTVKIGYFGNLAMPLTVEEQKYIIDYRKVFVILLLLLFAFLALFAAREVIITTRERQSILLDIRALVAGSELPHDKKIQREVARMKKRGTSLRVKFTLFFTLLVIAVVFLVAIPLGLYMISTQEENLTRGLKNRTEVLLESLATGARTYLPSRSTLELLQLPSQISAMEEAVYATITGFDSTSDNAQEIVWASNDENITEKIDGAELVTGQSILTDEITERRKELTKELNQKASQALADLPEQIESLGRQALNLALRTDAESQKKLADLQQTIRQLDTQLRKTLSEISSVVESQPYFDTTRIDYNQRIYVFYKPVMYRVSGENNYVHGMVRLAVSTDKIIEEVESARATLIKITALITLIAVILGIVGALILSAITVGPIKRLVAGVEVIRDTEDKEKLANHVIELKSKDELALLADTINEMTQGLVKAAAASKDLTVGKEVQKMFIPLEKDESGRKMTTAHEETERVSIFGYYEGAKGVSGDYFYYQKLDAEHYAFIKCDVAGKGVPAALIMVEVATVFLNYCQKVNIKRDGVHLDTMLSEINDLIAGREFKGRFAAMTVGLYNERTGVGYFTNAGDTLLHYYSSKDRSIKEIRLPTAPAAGVFDSSLVDMQGGFKQIKLSLNPGDVLILFTDGLEEANRALKDRNFNPYTITEEDIRARRVPEGMNPGESTEEFGLTRIKQIVNSIQHRRQYKLERLMDPEDKQLVFDFSSLNGGAKDIVLGLLAVEKVFRVYRVPGVEPKEPVVVDRAIDEYLRNTFLAYNQYFSDPVPDPERHEYLLFKNLMSDEQYDDLTVFAIERKK
ncbi:SpoIIE family protein phosphatase [Spirochaetia bacterium 38H-sp]|uniref:SpoIIE family protein phosphatase n=1 Tax=Rarispira pelagica TaxID=3141764 RepID=A0ABU9UB40_9SPIR